MFLLFDTIKTSYHGGALAQLKQGNICTSNQENEEGGSFPLCWSSRSDQPRHMIKDAHKVAPHIKDKNYVSDLLLEGYENVMTYGFAFCEKCCRVAKGETYSDV